MSIFVPEDNVPTVVDVSAPDNLEDERWQAHARAHARDQEVADKAARDVKEALDKAAIEVTGRLTEVRAYIDQVLKSHADLHGADREALLLARGVLEKELREINNVREQIASDRALLPTGDVVRTLVAASKTETQAQLIAHAAEEKASMATHITDERAERGLIRDVARENSNRIGKLESDVKDATATRKMAEDNQAKVRALENTLANLNGRLAAYGVVFLLLVTGFEWLVRGGRIG